MNNLFNLQDKIAIVTGGTGVLGSAMARGLAAAGAKVGILGRRGEKAAEIAQTIRDSGGEALSLVADVLERGQLEEARTKIMDSWDQINILVNAAGGNKAEATIFGDLSFFSLTKVAFEEVISLNLSGTLLPCQVFGDVMATQRSGAIINISSMTAQKPLTRVLGYGNAKAGVENFTRWLAVEMAQKYGPKLRVNAIAPGFFIGEQNRDFLLGEDGRFTPRGQQIIDHTPMGRLGEPEELIGTVVWLASDASRFVNGIVVPVDGGFSAFSGI